MDSQRRRPRTSWTPNALTGPNMRTVRQLARKLVNFVGAGQLAKHRPCGAWQHRHVKAQGNFDVLG
jgi:hypothetical protein